MTDFQTIALIMPHALNVLLFGFGWYWWQAWKKKPCAVWKNNRFTKCRLHGFKVEPDNVLSRLETHVQSNRAKQKAGKPSWWRPRDNKGHWTKA